MDTPDRYAVFGNPIEHSRSPQIHAAFAKQTRQHLSYKRQRVDEGGFVVAANDFFASGGKGLNVTVPFKQDAYRYASELSRRAQRAGAVNTLAPDKNGTIYGDNTDGVGLCRDIRDNLGWPVAGKRVLLVGAGGAVRGVLEPLFGERPAEIVIANRTMGKATDLAEAFADLGPRRACGFANLESEGSFDLLINGTSASLAGDLPPLPPTLVGPATRAYDMMYAKSATVFMTWAAKLGAETADGLGMLVEQAAESFALWRGVHPDTGPVIDAVRRSL